MNSIIGVIGVLLLTFVIIPWTAMTLIKCIKNFWDENNRFD